MIRRSAVVGLWALVALSGYGQESAPTHEPATVPRRITVVEDDEYLPRVEHVLQEARSSIRLIMFSVVVPDDVGARHPVRRLLTALIAQQRAGVQVEVVLDHGVPPTRRTKAEEPPSDRAYALLKAAGVAVRWDEDERTTHVKCLIVDERVAVIGSHNWTASALTKNREWSVEVDDPVVVADLTARFRRVWAAATP